MAQRIDSEQCLRRRLTFELSRPAEEDTDWPRKDDNKLAWSGQTVAAVAGRRLERGVRPHSAHAWRRVAHLNGRLGFSPSTRSFQCA